MVSVKEWYVATFKWSEHIYCTNLVQTDDLEKAEEHYAEYEDVSFRPAKTWEVESYSERGMPIIEVY